MYREELNLLLQTIKDAETAERFVAMARGVWLDGTARMYVREVLLRGI
jgi:hypothetical protein